MLPVATYDTDYLFVREDALAAAVAALRAAGPHSRHRVVTGDVLIRPRGRA